MYYHDQILNLILANATKGTKHTLLDNYLGTQHPRHAITVPVLRGLAKHWMAEHERLTAKEFSALLTSLINAESYTEKCIAGILLDYASAEQRRFDLKLFDTWLEHLEGWAEIDTLCTGNYSRVELPLQWKKWKAQIRQFAKSKNISKRRAALVLFCSPLIAGRHDALAQAALETVERLKNESDILITKAISWVLRSMIKHHRQEVSRYVKENASTLPKIAVRETMTKLKTGTKSNRKK